MKLSGSGTRLNYAAQLALETGASKACVPKLELGNEQMIRRELNCPAFLRRGRGASHTGVFA